MKLFSKVEINISLIEAIKQIPMYVKFLKELFTNKRRTMCFIEVEHNIQKSMYGMHKCSDPSVFTIPCTIGKITVTNCVLDLSASVNVLPYSWYLSLRLGALQHAGLTIQLADRSCKQL